MTEAQSRKTQRTAEQVREHYVVERKLAARLRKASKKERRTLYSFLYEELYRLVPHHPQLTRKASPEEQRESVKSQMILLAKYLNRQVTFLEVGPGDCAFSFEVAKFVKEVYAVDVSQKITKSSSIPSNFRLYISDGSSIPVPTGSVDIVYSNQLMEHLHIDDAYEQLKNIFNALAPGGFYLCITPNRLNGPHDISRDFDTEATGFHLKEYTIAELNRLFKKVGFSKVILYIGAKGKYIRLPIFPSVMCEHILELLPNQLRKKLVGTKLIKQLIAIRLIGIK